jgi:hypothetical protein
VLLWATTALAGIQRFAVLVGNNEGFAGNAQLYFAEQDARKMGAILADLGDVPGKNARLLLSRNRNDLLHALADVRAPIAAARATGDHAVLYFYYSGHADAEQLQLGRSWLTYAELEELLDKSGADVRVAFVDACQSGALARKKGGTRAPSFVFDVHERLDSKGSVIITSSTGDEASQESDEIGGSYFTHYLASALGGGADDDEDGRVTLGETYRYVYHQVVYRTSTTRLGAQHPTYEWKLSGTGDLVITETSRAGAYLEFPAAQPGTFAVFDAERRVFVAEVEVAGQDRRLGVRPGRYLVQRRFPTFLSVADVSVAPRTTLRLDAARYRHAEYEDDVAKGSIDATIARAKLPRLSVHALFGARGFLDEQVQDEYFPGSVLAGVEARANWRDGRWISLDVLGGTGRGSLVLPELSYDIPVQVGSGTFGLGLGFSTREALFQVGGGLHLEGVYLERSFPGTEEASQSLFTIAPGGMAYVGWHPGRFEMELSLRTHYLPYVVDDRDAGMAFNELALSLGYRW